MSNLSGMASPPATRAPAGTVMARWSAKALLVTAGILLVGGALWYARTVTVPLIVSALIATQLLPLVGWLQARGVPRAVAVTGGILGVIALAVGLVWLFAAALFGQLGGIADDLSAGADDIIAWLQRHNDWIAQNEQEIRDFLSGLLPAAKTAADGLLSGVLTGLSLAAQLVSFALFALVFLLYLVTGGDQVWAWVCARFSPERRTTVDAAGVAAWNAATGYVRGIALVALIDSTVIAVGMLIFGTPLVFTLALLSFVTLFIPILGAWVSGTVIVLVTLGAEGTGAALGMTAVILIAQQLDSMFVTPLVYQKTVALHPIVTLSGVVIGSQLMGIVGAFLAVPLIAVGWAVWKTLEQPAPAPAAEPAPG